jgi:hypothetical protein
VYGRIRSEQAWQRRDHVGEIVDLDMPDRGLPAICGELWLRQDASGLGRDTEIGSAVPDQQGRPGRPAGNRAFAGAAGRAAGWIEARKFDPPPVGARADESIAHIGKIETDPSQHPRDNPIEAVRSDHQVETELLALRGEGGEGWIDLELADQCVKIAIGRSDQVDLARQTFARADATGGPVILDHAPFGKGKPFENQIGGVLANNRSIEIDENEHGHTYISPDLCRHTQGVGHTAKLQFY